MPRSWCAACGPIGCCTRAARAPPARRCASSMRARKQAIGTQGYEPFGELAAERLSVGGAAFDALAQQLRAVDGADQPLEREALAVELGVGRERRLAVAGEALQK